MSNSVTMSTSSRGNLVMKTLLPFPNRLRRSSRVIDGFAERYASSLAPSLVMLTGTAQVSEVVARQIGAEKPQL
jgi:hypothetical protein